MCGERAREFLVAANFHRRPFCMLARRSCAGERENEGRICAPRFYGFALKPRYFATACFAIFSSEPNALLSCTARSASALRLSVTPDFFKPLMKSEYDMPSARTAALMRLIHNERKSRLRTRRSRNEYDSDLSSASFATR